MRAIDDERGRSTVTAKADGAATPMTVMEVASALRQATNRRFGYSIPDLEDFVWRKSGPDWLLAPRGFDASTAVQIRSGAGSGNIVCVNGPVSRQAVINFNGSDNLIFLGGNSSYSGTVFVFSQGHRQVMFLGNRCDINGINVLLIGDDRRLIIGDDCLFATGISIRTQDQHGLIDLSTGEWLNPPKDVHIEPHVWLGKDASVHSGVTIGFGAVIGERSIVKSDIPRKTVAVGAPARVVKKNVSWSHSFEPWPQIMDFLYKFERGIDATCEQDRLSVEENAW